MSIKYLVCIVLMGSSLSYGMEEDDTRSLKSSKSDESALAAIKRQRNKDEVGNEDLGCMQQVAAVSAIVSNDRCAYVIDLLTHNERSFPLMANLKIACHFAQTHSNAKDVKNVQQAIAVCICNNMIELPSSRHVTNVVYSHFQQEFIRDQLLKLKPIQDMFNECGVKERFSLRNLLMLYEFMFSFRKYVEEEKKYENTNASRKDVKSHLQTNFWADRLENLGFPSSMGTNKEAFLKIVAAVERKLKPERFSGFELFKPVAQGKLLVATFYRETFDQRSGMQDQIEEL